MKNLVLAVLSAFLLFGCSSDEEIGVSNQHPKDLEIICPLVSVSSDEGYIYTINYVYEESKLVYYTLTTSDGYPSTIATYKYNAQGLLSEEKAGGVTTYYEYDEADRLIKTTQRYPTGALRNKSSKGARFPFYQLLNKRRSHLNTRLGNSETEDDYTEYQYRAGEFYPYKLVSYYSEGGEKGIMEGELEYKNGNVTRVVLINSLDDERVEYLMHYDDKPLSDASVPFAVRFESLQFAVNNLILVEGYFNGKLTMEDKSEPTYSENGLIAETKLSIVAYDEDGEVTYSEEQVLKYNYQCD
ncbi:hypothetical protein [Persicobacter psychrovividus]|uniref:DUF4595 domain-containing protein n=1 Tax=Persicobacter psychrovividus TaxID=387638 RepID=A0ABM7VCC2_9BACT|nr:hypothetical protein PEPS_06090 [Persicobacter psychrovividus]